MEQPVPQNIQKLLLDLERNMSPGVRMHAALRLGEFVESDERIISNLKRAATLDADPNVRRAALNSLPQIERAYVQQERERLEVEKMRATEKKQGEKPSGAGNRNPRHEQLLKKEFGLDYGEGGGGFDGAEIIDMAARFTKPDICFGELKHFRKRVQFSHLCIVATDTMTVLVCNTKPTPTCFVSGLDTSGVASLIAMSLKDNEGEEVYDYRNTWLLSL